MRVIVLVVLIIAGATGKAQSVDYETPIKYTAVLMATEFLMLNAFDLADDEVGFDNFRSAWKDPKPALDDDSDVFNLVLHPLMGSETYLRARDGKFGIYGSIAFSMIASATWEYLIESWTEHPSSQDLLFTTGIGWMLGELRYQLKSRFNENKGFSFIVDPILHLVEHLDIKVSQQDDGTVSVIGLIYDF